jgi:hypothetical protein
MGKQINQTKPNQTKETMLGFPVVGCTPQFDKPYPRALTGMNVTTNILKKKLL